MNAPKVVSSDASDASDDANMCCRIKVPTGFAMMITSLQLLQMVVGCAINLCYNMNVWGQIWAKAVYLVCNYSPK